MNHSHTTALALLATVLGASACSGGSDDSESVSFQMRSTNVATSSSTPIRISGAYLAFLAAEDATSSGGNPGTILNGDGDVADQIAHVVNTVTRAEFRLGVAADDLAWAGSELFLAVDEGRDGRDWNGDMLQTDDVLLHWSETTGLLAYVDDLATDAALSVLGLDSRVLYVAKTATAGAGGSNLRFIESSLPTTPIPVATTDAGPNEISPRILGEDEGLVFLAFDETLVGRSLNGDADALDANVLGLLDGTDAASVARPTARAVDPASPRRAKSIAAGDWRVGFLVSEAGQNATNLNSSAVGANFRPAHCTANDTDVTDDVLAVLTFAAWDADPLANPPINHGLAGRDRIAFAGNYVATIVAEADDTCDLNNDSDSTDNVVRWVAIADLGDPILPINTDDEIRALFDAPGGGHGLYELSNRFVIVSSEAQGGDIDVNPLDANLVGWLSPAPSSTSWDFFHGTSGTEVVETSWVSARESEGRLGVAFSERIGNVSLNQGSVQVPGDTDVLDSIPTFATFSSNRLIFPGVLLALDKDSAGMATARGWTFYRLSESEDSRDINGDGDETDFILERTNVASGATFGMSVATDVQRDVAEFARFGSKDCGAVIASEAQQGSGGTDFNGDGDRTDLVLRWFRF